MRHESKNRWDGTTHTTRFSGVTLATIAGLLCAASVFASDRVVAWGDLAYDQTQAALGRAGRQTPAIAAGSFHSVALNAEGKLAVW